MQGWNDWYHAMIGTYGTWLPGDHRGWHERNHHEHVDGDYHHPPPQTDFLEGRWRHSRDQMRFDPFLIPRNDQKQFGEWILESFRHQHIPIAAVAVTTTNFHALMQCKASNRKIIVGRVKAHVTIAWGNREDDAGRARRPIWGGGSLPKPINDESHGHEVYQYILDHENEGAWIWSHRPRTPR